jgi:D-alanyl-D-alanine carboxypeptidase
MVASLTATASASAAPQSSSSGPLPACRYDDVLTPRHDYDVWDKTMLDTALMVPKSYAPPDLVSVSAAGIDGAGKVRRLVIPDLRAMAAAARAARRPIAVESAYRSYTRQRAIFNSHVRRIGFERAALASARPGHSEHQLGTTIDFKSRGGQAPWKLRDWARTPAGRWMRDNAWRYGFVMSYPAATSPRVSCYQYEPWHYHYIGREAALQVVESGLAPREWQWAQGYGTDVGVDTVAPSMPGGLSALSLPERRVELTWSASVDDRPGNVSYDILRDGIAIATTDQLTYIDQLNANGTYRYAVRAIDSAGNTGAPTPPLSVEVDQ